MKRIIATRLLLVELRLYLLISRIARPVNQASEHPILWLD